MADFPAPSEGFVLTHFIISADVGRSAAFYTEVLGGEAVMEGEPTIIQLANSWVIINVGGGPTDDKPEVVLDVPDDPNRVSAFLNIRVADIQGCYEEWSSKGAEFLTEPEAARQRDPLLHARPGRLPDRGGPGDRNALRLRR